MTSYFLSYLKIKENVENSFCIHVQAHRHLGKLKLVTLFKKSATHLSIHSTAYRNIYPRALI